MYKNVQTDRDILNIRITFPASQLISLLIRSTWDGMGGHLSLAVLHRIVHYGSF